MLVGYGTSLSLAGRTDEAEPLIDEGLSLARELQNQSLVAHSLNAAGENAFYRGDLKTARARFEQAHEVALTTGNLYSVLISQANAAKVAAHDGRTALAITELTTIQRQADSLALKPLSAECSVYRGRALLNGGQSAEASKVLEAAVLKAETLGMRPLLARAHYLLAEALAATRRTTDAEAHRQQAAGILDQLTKEGGADSLVNRFDLRPLQSGAGR